MYVLSDESLTEYLMGTVIERMWNAQLNEMPHFHVARSEARSIFELESMAFASIHISGTWRGVLSCAADQPALDLLASKLVVITAEMTFREKQSALLIAADFIYHYLSVAIGPDLLIRQPTITALKPLPPSWLFDQPPIYDKCVRLGAGKFWLTLVKT